MNILPSYACNLACPFCAIHQLDKGDLLDLDWLEKQIKEIPAEQIDILGGEPSLLPEEYLDRLISICRNKTGKKPGMYSNLIIKSPLLDKVELTVSYDPGSRQKSSRVLANMLTLEQPFEINTIATKPAIERGPEYLIKLAARMPNLKRITLSTLTVFPGCEDLRPEPEALKEFCLKLIELDKNNLIHFYPIATWQEDYIKRMDPAQTVEILPNKKFRIALRDFQGVREFDTYKEAAAYYEDNYSQADGQCKRCEFFRRCPHMYSEIRCKEDYEIAKAIKERLS